MNEASFLSKLLLGLGILLLAASFLLLPMSLTTQTTGDQLRMTGLRDVLDRDGMVLPYPTRLSIAFTDRPLLRMSVFVFLLAVGLAGEIFIKDRKIAGVVHLANICIGLGVGSYFALSLVLPFPPL